MVHNITKTQYLKDPCGCCSIAYWKNKSYQMPNGMNVIHEKDWRQSDDNSFSITRYFKLIHHLRNIDSRQINDSFYFQTVDINNQIEEVKDFINNCYDDISVTSNEVEQWTKNAVFDNELWLFVYENNIKHPVGLGIADFDRQIMEGSLEWIQVLPEKQGLGLGKAIVNELLMRLKHKAKFATVSGQVNNPANPESLYRRCGFTGTDVWYIAEPNR